MAFYLTSQHELQTFQEDFLKAIDDIYSQYNSGEISQIDAENNIRLMKESGSGWKTLPIPSPPWLEKPNRGIFDYITGERIKKAMAPGKEPNPEDPPYRPRPPGGPPWPGYPKPMPPGGPPPKLAGGPSFDINEGANTRKIRGIRKLQEGGSAGEKNNAEKILKKISGPQLPLAQVDYTSPHPKFDQHMKNTPPLTQPKERIDHLKKGVNIRKA
tara:strand:+ start:1003 stop:1644 length:642 start_codon:yes stop_codon:yes gene_type:complete